MKKLFLLTAGLFLLTTNVHAARPLATADAGTVDVGAVEIEYGFEHAHAGDKEFNNSLAITTGLLDNLDFAVEIPYQSLDSEDGDDESGMADIKISTKLNIIKEKEAMPDLSILFSFKEESGAADKGIGTDEVEYGITGILSKEFANIAVHLNLGSTIKHDAEDTFNYNFAVEYSLNEKTNLVGEITGDTVLSGKFNDNATSAQLGMNHSINDIISWDLGAAVGISKSEPDYKVTTGLTFAFGG